MCRKSDRATRKCRSHPQGATATTAGEGQDKNLGAVGRGLAGWAGPEVGGSLAGESAQQWHSDGQAGVAKRVTSQETQGGWCWAWAEKLGQEPAWRCWWCDAGNGKLEAPSLSSHLLVSLQGLVSEETSRKSADKGVGDTLCSSSFSIAGQKRECWAWS